MKEIRKPFIIARTGVAFLFLIPLILSGMPLFAQTEGLIRAEQIFYVSLRGNDHNDGSLMQPFKNFKKAQSAVRKINDTIDVRVIVESGVYELQSPLIFTAKDGGQKGHNVTWQGWTETGQGSDKAGQKNTRTEQGSPKKPQKTVLSGGTKITNWRLFNAQKNIYVASVSRKFGSRQLYVNGQMAKRAEMKIPRDDIQILEDGILLNKNSIPTLNIAGKKGIELRALGHFTSRYSPVKEILPVKDHKSQKLIMQQPAWSNNIWGYDTIAYPYLPENGELFLVNALSFLDQEGEWYLDQSAGKLYYKPKKNEDLKTANVTLPRLGSLIHIAGRYGHPVKNLTLRDFQFSYTSWTGPSHSEGYASQQSGSFLTGTAKSYPKHPLVTCKWGCPEFETQRNFWNQMPSAFQISAAEGIRLTGNIFAHLGQYALGIGNDDNAHASGLGLGTVDIIINQNIFTDLAGGAILAGGVRADAHHPSDIRMVNRQLMIKNNIIHGVSKDYTDHSAILVTYVDRALILHNDISDTPYDAIDIGYGWGMHDAGGNDNYRTRMHGYEPATNIIYETPTMHRNVVVGYNRIYNAKTHFEDGGAIYNLSASKGTLIMENHIFDIGHRIALYLDEGSKDITVQNNVTEGVWRWLNINAVTPALPLRISSDNLARGNWHDTNNVGGRWTSYLNNLIKDDHYIPSSTWPDAACEVIKNAGIETEVTLPPYKNIIPLPKQGCSK